MTAATAAICLAIAAAGIASPGTTAAQSADVRQSGLLTNEVYLDSLSRSPEVDVSDPVAVLDHVLQSLPETVHVYPTENYFYFKFVRRGVVYAGSIRLGADDRDRGRLELGYYKEPAEWRDQVDDGRHTYLDRSNGVVVERLAPLTYQVTSGGRSVKFKLNDLSGVRPPTGTLLADETFIGPIFDESGVRFLLVYNSRSKIFHYVLDESVGLPDELLPLERAERIEIGRRTGFAFYRDHRARRRILVGVFEANSRLNTYFDGPFDQLPENLIEGEALREAIVASDAEARGKIDRLGRYLDGDGRYLIHPFMLYRKPKDLLRIDACATAAIVKPRRYGRCFVVAPQIGADGGGPAPSLARNGSRRQARGR